MKDVISKPMTPLELIVAYRVFRLESPSVKMLGSTLVKCLLIILLIQLNNWLRGSTKASPWQPVSTSLPRHTIWPKKVFGHVWFGKQHPHWVIHSYSVTKLVEMMTFCSMEEALSAGLRERLFKAPHGAVGFC